METKPCGTTWAHAMHIHPGGYCPGVWWTAGGMNVYSPNRTEWGLVMDPERILAVARGMQSRGGWANDQWETLTSEARGRWMSRAEYAVMAVDEYDADHTVGSSDA